MVSEALKWRSGISRVICDQVTQASMLAARKKPRRCSLVTKLQIKLQVPYQQHHHHHHCRLIITSNKSAASAAAQKVTSQTTHSPDESRPRIGRVLQPPQNTQRRSPPKARLCAISRCCTKASWHRRPQRRAESVLVVLVVSV